MEKTLPVYSTEICRNLLLGRFALPGSFLLLIIAVLVTPVAAQQEVIIKGKVTELVDGTALPGVNVLIKGTAAGTTTDVSGEYTLSAPTGSILIFSFVGYFPEEIVVTNQTRIDVPMSPDITTLQEMIVVGYGTVKREDLTGSVVSIKNDQFNPGANMSVAQALQGRAPGVQVYQKSGEPGSAMSVKIRGISSIMAGNDPLYVIDGMPVNNISPVGSPSAAGISNNPNPRNPLNSLNPADIESIEILKDASATAIYGSRGTNGVVLITTKKGSAGALKINYNVQVGTQRVSNRLDLLSGTEYRDALNGIIDAGGGAGAARVDENVLDTDWQKEVSRSAPIQSHDLSISGGKDNTRFYASLGYFDQQGVLLNSGTKRYNARLNIENAIDKKYAFGMTMNASYLKDDYNSVGLGINENGSGMYSAVYYDPTVPVYDENGGYFRAPSIGTNMDNPVALMRGQYAKSNTYRVFGSVYGEYFILPELSAKVKVAGDLNTSRRNGWIDPSTLIGLQSNGIASVWTGESNYYLMEGTLNYNKKFGDDHAVNAVFGTTYEHFGTNTFNGTGRGYLTPDLSYNAIGTGASDLNLLGSGRQSAILASYLGRVNYSFKNRYLFTASFRADGSSRFGANNRFGYFPSAAVAWKIQEEPFLANVGFIDELKLRGSYGTVGNQAIGNYQFIRTYGASSAGPVFDNTRNTIFFPTRLANPDLKWESSKQADIGVDFQFFDHRITGSIEYYNRKTTDLLLPVPQPPSTGYADRTENVGSIRNSGIEVALAGDIFRGDNFTWNLGGNMATVKNEVLDLGPNKQILNGGIGSIPAGSVITKPGEALGSYYGYRVVGVWQTNDDYTGWPASVKPGDLKFYDKDDSKSITAEDRVILGSSIPDFTYGITSTWTYKTISLQAYFEGSQGGYLLNSTAADTYFPTAFRRNKLAEPYLNRWTPENPSNEYPSFVNPTSQGQQVVNSRTVENASYFRLQSVRLSYTLPLSRGPIKNVQFYAVGQNLFVITDYNGIDPTANSLGDDVAKVDYNSYPMVRTFLLGANIQF